MELNKWDMVMIVSMSLSIILMSFVFPQLGLTGNGDAVENESSVPELRMGNSTFDMVGDFPQQPTTPSNGVLTYDQQQGNSIGGVTQEWVERPKEDGYSIEVQNTSQDGFTVTVTNFNESGTDDLYRYDITGEEGQEILHDEDDYVITFDVESVENYNEPNMTAEVEWTVEQSPDEAEGISSIPLIGGVADEVANVLGFIAVVITWGVMSVMEFAINAVVIIFEVSVFLVDLLSWLGSTYFTIVEGASGWASIVLIVPGIIISLEFGKLGLIVVSLLPTT